MNTVKIRFIYPGDPDYIAPVYPREHRIARALFWALLGKRAMRAEYGAACMLGSLHTPLGARLRAARAIIRG
jgi:hypothetical protein